MPLQKYAKYALREGIRTYQVHLKNEVNEAEEYTCTIVVKTIEKNEEKYSIYTSYKELRIWKRKIGVIRNTVRNVSLEKCLSKGNLRSFRESYFGFIMICEGPYGSSELRIIENIAFRKAVRRWLGNE